MSTADWDGAGYERISALQRWLAERSLAGIGFRGDERLLDVGCGDGFVTRALAARLPRGEVLGVDASPRMIAVARARPAQSSSEPPGAPLRFERRDALDLAGLGPFDVVVSFNTLHWVHDQRAALAAIAGVTVPGGRVIVQQVCGGPRPSLESVAMQVCATPRWAPFFAGFEAPFVHVDPDAYPGIAAAAGLVVQTLDVQDLTWDFPSRDDFARWSAVGSTDWTRRLPPDEVDEWVADEIAAYEPIAGTPGRFRFLQLRAELTPADRPD